MAYIYILTNKISNKKYVGQTKRSITQRFNEHILNKCNSLIHKAIYRHCWGNFKKFYFWCPIYLLNFFEKLLIFILNTLAPNGYNLTTGGKNTSLSEETKKKISESHADFSGSRSAWFGRHHTEESKKKVSQNNARLHKIICIDTGEIFNSIREAQRKYFLHYSCISNCCRGERNTAGGYHWSYYNG